MSKNDFDANDETQLRIMRVLHNNPEHSQRQMAKELNVSVGKINYCLRALLDKGYIKINNFNNSSNKLKYVYLLTPKGISEKAKLTANFVYRKMREYEKLKNEIEVFSSELK